MALVGLFNSGHLDYVGYVDTSDFTYELPEELIAQHPASKRDESRLMVVRRASRRIEHTTFKELPGVLSKSDLLVVNNTRVFPARLFGVKAGGASRIEVLLLKEVEPECWEALVRPGRRLRPGSRVVFEPGKCEAEVLSGSRPETRRLRFKSVERVVDWVIRNGIVPLPPYIKRERADHSEEDRTRYQTVYAKEPKSVAAPTAGLHFTDSLLSQIPHQEITLHVGYGTFKPITADRVEDHEMESEFYSISVDQAGSIQGHLDRGWRIIAVGTTTTRALEHVVLSMNRVVPSSGWTSLFIYPGFRFKVVGGLLTNFHLPGSTLLLLVSAFAGNDLIREAYDLAVKEKYRFYSYGDAMLIL